MARTRAILTDPDRNLISSVLMDAQALQEETARILAFRVQKHVRQARELREAQARLTAAEARADRSAWDGTCRRSSDRRSDYAATA